MYFMVSSSMFHSLSAKQTVAHSRSLTDLKPGQYAVQFALPSGYTFTKSADLLGDIQFDNTFAADGSFALEDVTSDANINTGITNSINVESGETNLSLDAGVYVPAKIQGLVWHDLNANGIKEEGEPLLENAIVSLYNDDDDYVGNVMSDSGGQFMFEDLTPDTYYAEIQPPTIDYFLSPTSQGGLAVVNSDFNPSTKENSPVVLISGDINQGQFDAGLYQLASVGDLVWLDTSADGIQDEDEPGFPFPVKINLYDVSNQLLSTMTTNETGIYKFQDLMPGSYEIEFIMEEGDILSPPFKGGDDTLDSDVNPTTSRAKVILVSGDKRVDVDAGIIVDAPYYP